MLAELEGGGVGLAPQAAQLPIASTVTGRLRGDNAGRSILVPEPAADGASGPRARGADW